MSRFTKRRITGALAAASAAALLLSACAPDTTGGNAEEQGITIFNGATGTIVENWNPFSPSLLQPSQGIIHEALYYYNLAAEDEPQPVLATGYEWNEDGTQLTITTREGVEWSDGEPFSSADVAFTFNLINETPALNTSGLNATAEATDDTTVVLTFDQTSFTQEPQVLGNQAIIPEHIWSEIDDPTTTINENPVGTGPYMLDEFSSESYTLSSNPNYWDGEPAIPSVRYISLATADAASAALLAGQVDWISTFFPDLETLIQDNPELSYVNTPALTTSLFACSTVELGCSGPQTDVAVRQAIYQAMDRTQLNELAGAGFAAPASPTLLLPDRDESWIADSDNVTAPQEGDPEAARATLEAAGYTEGSDGIYERDGQRVSLTVQVVSGYSDYISAIDVMTTQLAEAGIELEGTQLSYNEWTSNEVNGNFQLTMDSIGLGASSNPFYTYQPRYNSANTAPVGSPAATSGNYARYSNPTVDAAIAAAGATDDEAVQQEQYGIIQDEIVRDLPYIPIYVNSTLTEFNTSRATGWPTNDDRYAFAATWKNWDNGIVLRNIEPAN